MWMFDCRVMILDRLVLPLCSVMERCLLSHHTVVNSKEKAGDKGMDKRGR